MITCGAFLSLSFVGMSRTFLGTALPEVRSFMDLSILQAGTLTALLQLGFSTAVFFGGPSVRRIQEKPDPQGGLPSDGV